MRCDARPEATRRPGRGGGPPSWSPPIPPALRCARAQECPAGVRQAGTARSAGHHEAAAWRYRARPPRPPSRSKRPPMRVHRQHEEPIAANPAERGHFGRQVDGDARGRGKRANAAPDQQLGPDELAADLCHRQQGIDRVADPAHPEQEGRSWPARAEDQRCPAEAEKRICGRRRARNREHPQDAPAGGGGSRRVVRGDTREATTASPTSRLTRLVPLTRAVGLPMPRLPLAGQEGLEAPRHLGRLDGRPPSFAIEPGAIRTWISAGPGARRVADRALEPVEAVAGRGVR